MIYVLYNYIYTDTYISQDKGKFIGWKSYFRDIIIYLLDICSHPQIDGTLFSLPDWQGSCFSTIRVAQATSRLAEAEKNKAQADQARCRVYLGYISRK